MSEGTAPETETTREPLHPAQDQLRVTEELTGIALEEHLCGVCTRVRGVGLHHIVFRSRGGHEGPVIPLCLACHSNLHAEGIWELDLLEDGMRIVEKETGEIVWRLMRWPFEGGPGEFVGLLDRVMEVERLMPQIAPALLPWQAAEAYQALKGVQDGGWRAQMHLVRELHDWRLPGRPPGERIEAICSLLGIRRSQVYSYLNVAKAFEGSSALDETPLGMSYLVEAAKTEEPEAWLRLAEERKSQHPSFSRDDLRQEIVLAGAVKETPKLGREETPATVHVWGRCPDCGTVGWKEKLPVGSEGDPVRVEEYRA